MPSAPFESDIAALVPSLQDLFAAALEACGCDGNAGITRISDRLGVHRKLAWQVRNVAYATDPYQAVRYMPTRAGIDTLIGALEGVDGVDTLVQGLRTKADDFDRLIETHAGDRTSFEMLVEAASGASGEQSEIKWREKAFLGNSFIWGARARAQLSVSILNFSADRPDHFDMAQVRGLIGLKRVRPNVHWLVGQAVILDGQQPRDRRRTPLDPEAAAAMDGVPILPQFCSEPLPRIRRRPVGSGIVNHELLPAPVGFTGQQTVMTGEIVRELAPVHATETNRRALFATVVRTPAQVFIYDMFVHRDLFPGVERQLCVFSELNSPVTQDENDRLPISESIQRLGSGLTGARTPDVPAYPQLLRSVFKRTGWNPEEFELHRVRLAYPPMPSSVVIRHDLPPR